MLKDHHSTQLTWTNFQMYLLANLWQLDNLTNKVRWKLIIICYICKCASVEIKPELKKNILNFGYGINYKYEGMLAHSFHRCYVVTKFILPTIKDLKFSTINFNDTCKYLQEKNECSVEAKQYISDLIIYCRKIIPFMHNYREQISSFNHMAHNILTNDILSGKEKKREALLHH